MTTGAKGLFTSTASASFCVLYSLLYWILIDEMCACLSQVMETLMAIEERHNQMRELEASMLQLHQVFVDMSILVYEQGQQLDSIESWVSILGVSLVFSHH